MKETKPREAKTPPIVKGDQLDTIVTETPFGLMNDHDQAFTIVKNRMSYLFKQFVVDKDIPDSTDGRAIEMRKVGELSCRAAIGRTMSDFAEVFQLPPNKIRPNHDIFQVELRVLLPRDVEKLVDDLLIWLDQKRRITILSERENQDAMFQKWGQDLKDMLAEAGPGALTVDKDDLDKALDILGGRVG